MTHDPPVVIALDGSPRSPHTLAWGMEQAAARGAPAVLVRVVPLPQERVYGGWWYPSPAEPALDEEARGWLDALAQREAARRPEVAVSSAVLHGQTVPELQRYAADARLLVVGAGGTGARRHVGPIAAHVAAHARCPVAVVRARSQHGTSVVVGVDGSPASFVAAHTAAETARRQGMPLAVVHARPTVVAPYGHAYAMPPVGEDADDPTRRAAQELADELRAAHPGLDVRLVLVDDDPANAVVEAAADADLVVVGSRGLGAFRGMLLGSVSAEVVRLAPCTVLVVHGT